jgi:protease IV
MTENNDHVPAKWEREVIEKMVYSALDEQRKARRWGLFFKLFMVFYVLALTLVATVPDMIEVKSTEHTALIDLEGVISSKTKINADDVTTALREAFEDEGTKGVVMRINSPGGSPVQSEYIYAEIKRLRKKYPDIPLYAVVTDLCASGGYYIASAADKIYAQKASMVGSIGVIMGGFGFTRIIDTLGIDRRMYTAGESKGFMDPFSKEKASDIAQIESMLEGVHQIFIDRVKEGRGDRLKDDASIFTGLIWTGEQAKELGLIDEFGSAGYVAREVIKEKEVVDFTVKEKLLERLARRIKTQVQLLVEEPAYSIR